MTQTGTLYIPSQSMSNIHTVNKVAIGQAFLPVLQLSIVTVIPPIHHTHPFI